MIERIEVLEVPFNSSGTEDGVARMPDALAAAGLYEVLRRRGDVDRRRVTFDSPELKRGPSGLLAERALVSMIAHLSAEVTHAVKAGSWPLVIGGDCSVLLGVLMWTKLADLDSGLLFVDGHEDAWPPRVSQTGETADCELGIALGWYPAPTPLHAHGPLIEVDDVVVLGPRDQAELASAAIPSIADRVQMVTATDLYHRDLRDVGTKAVTQLRSRSSVWWLHIDLDVLATEALPAVDYPQPGGLSWIQLEDVTAAALRVGGCIGASVVIYNPDLDDGAHAGQIVAFLEQLIAGIWEQQANQG